MGGKSKIAALAGLALCLACSSRYKQGHLFVEATNPGNFEVYKIESEIPLQFTSEIIGHFNEELALDPGHYLILADCSSENIIVKPNNQIHLVAHTINFNTPTPPSQDDLFSIQCDRHASTQSRQFHAGKYSLNVLAGSRDLLVGMVPFTPDTATMQGRDKPAILTYELAAIMVSAYPDMMPGTRYFVSPVNDLMAITQNQEFGSKQFLLPGDYTVEVNGTSITTRIEAKKEEIITPSFVVISTDKTSLHLGSQIKGVPVYAEINNHHHIELDHIYPTLPGSATLSLSDSTEVINIALEPGKLTESKVRSLIVHSECSPWDWTCIGRTEIFIFIGDSMSPTATGVTDMPLMFFSNDAWVSLQGSKDIKIRVPEDQYSHEFFTGTLKVRPIPTHRNGSYTDLARIESDSKRMTGQSLDLSLRHEEELLLIEGTYNLGLYETPLNTDLDRKKTVRPFRIANDTTTTLSFPAYTTDSSGIKNSGTSAETDDDKKSRNISVHQLIPISLF